MADTTQTSDARTWYLSVLERFGYPTFVTLVLGYGVYAGLAWTGSNVAEPLVTSHIQFLKVSEELGRKHATSMEKMLQTQEQLMHQQAELTAANREIVKSLEELTKKIAVLGEKKQP